MGLRGKILSGFLILTIMLFLAGLWSIYEFKSIGVSVQKLLDDNYKSINAAKSMIEALERQDSGVLLLLSGKRDQGRSILVSADKLFEESFAVVKNNVTVPGEQAYVDRIATKYKPFKELWTQPIVGTGYEKNLDWYFQGLHGAFLEAKAAVDDLMALNQKAMYQVASDLQNRAHRATMPGIVAILAALVFSLVFNYFVNVFVVNPIIKMSSGIQRFIETRENPDIHVETRDELAKLSSSLQDLIARVGTLKS